jgi:molybdenum cofactor cytidylyltransferase
LEKLPVEPEQAFVISETAVVIPAAGSSSRMGTHKALLQFDEQYNFIQKIVLLYTEVGIRKIVVVVNKDNSGPILASLKDPQFGKVLYVLNEHPEWERFYSIKCGLAQISGYEKCFIHNCDNPFVCAEVIIRLLNGFLADGITIPVHEGRKGHPVLLAHNIIQAVMGHGENTSNFRYFLENYSHKCVTVYSEDILYNINSKQDYILKHPFSG